MSNYNKILLAAVLAALPIAANAAEAPKVKIGGRMDFQAGTIHESSGYRNTIPGVPSAGQELNNHAFVNDTKIDFEIEGKINQDIKYGGLIRLNADTSIATSQKNTVADKTMVFLQHEKIGRFEAGNMPGAGGLFEMDTVNLAHGSYGVDGFTTQWINQRTKKTSVVFYNAEQFLKQNVNPAAVVPQLNTRAYEFIMFPNLPSNYSGHFYSDAPKINFFTKPIKELTLGIAYIPDMDSAGTVRNIAPKNSGPLDAGRDYMPASFRDVISGGFVVDKNFNKDFGIKTGLTGEIGKAKLDGIEDLRAMEAGLMFIYKNIKFGGTYGNWFKSLTLKERLPGAKRGASYFTLGFSQEIEKFGYSLTYMNSKKAGGIEIAGKKIIGEFQQKLNGFSPVTQSNFIDKKMNKYQNFVIDVDYKLAPGFLPYATFSMFDLKESTGAKDKAYVGLAGVRLLF